jgi:hypothetical protein
MAWADIPLDGVPKVGGVLREFCADCHLGDSPEAGFSLAALDPSRIGGSHAAAWLRLGEQVKFAEMPPHGSPQPTREERRQILAWLADSLRGADVDTTALESALTGNAVDHELLFTLPVTAPLDNPPRLWRFSPQLYFAVIGGGSGTDPMTQAMTGGDGHGFEDMAGTASIDDGVLAIVRRNAARAARGVTAHRVEDGVVVMERGGNKEFKPLLDPTNEPTDKEITTAIGRMLFYKRLEPLSAEEGSRFVRLYRSIRGAGDAAAASRALVVAALLQPEMLYRMELGLGRVEEDGRRMLDPIEIAYALNAALRDTRQERDRSRDGKLDSREAVAAEVDRMLAKPFGQNPRILRFFQEYFGYTAAPDVFKDKSLNEYFYAPSLVGDTDKLVLHILEKDQDVLQELLTTTQTYAAARSWDKDADEWSEVYPNAKAWMPYGLQAFPRQQPVQLPPRERAGILTQPSWLVAHSDNFNNNAITRGKWVRERLLGGRVPDVPITVDAKISEDDTLTLRERMVKTTDSYCWQCHRRMNPLGLPFEIYDHFGRFRTAETVVDRSKPMIPGKRRSDPPTPATAEVPLDSSGEIAGSGDPVLDGPVTDAIDMIQRLARSARVRQVFIRHAFRYWMGREENLGDAQTLRDADRAYVESGGSMKALIKSLLTSDSFLYRTVPPNPPRRPSS